MSSWAYADSICPSQVIEHVKIEEGNAFYKQKNAYWRKLGNLESLGVQASYSLMLTAKATRDIVQVSYPDGYDCSVINLITDATNAKTSDFVSGDNIDLLITDGYSYDHPSWRSQHEKAEKFYIPIGTLSSHKVVLKGCDFDQSILHPGPESERNYSESGELNLNVISEIPALVTFRNAQRVYRVYPRVGTSSEFQVELNDENINPNEMIFDMTILVAEEDALYWYPDKDPKGYDAYVEVRLEKRCYMTDFNGPNYIH